MGLKIDFKFEILGILIGRKTKRKWKSGRKKKKKFWGLKKTKKKEKVNKNKKKKEKEILLGILVQNAHKMKAFFILKMMKKKE